MAYNEGEFIYYSLSSILPFCDEVVVVEGATKLTKKITGSIKSQDNTIAEIKRVDDPNGKIKLFSKLYKDKKNAQNYGLNHRSIEPDYLLVHGGDEVYKHCDLERALNKLSRYKKLNAVRTPFYHFWHDFWHIASGGGWDIYQGRLYKFLPDCVFKVHYSLGNSKVLRLDNGSSHYPKSVHNYPRDPESPHVFHYAYLKGKQNQEDKYIYHRIRDRNDKRLIKKIRNDFVVASAWSRWKIVHSTNKKTFSHVYPFNLEHPEIMKKHPKYNLFKPTK